MLDQLLILQMGWHPSVPVALIWLSRSKLDAFDQTEGLAWLLEGSFVGAQNGGHILSYVGGGGGSFLPLSFPLSSSFRPGTCVTHN